MQAQNDTFKGIVHLKLIILFQYSTKGDILSLKKEMHEYRNSGRYFWLKLKLLTIIFINWKKLK